LSITTGAGSAGAQFLPVFFQNLQTQPTTPVTFVANSTGGSVFVQSFSPLNVQTSTVGNNLGITLSGNLVIGSGVTLTASTGTLSLTANGCTITQAAAGTTLIAPNMILFGNAAGGIGTGTPIGIHSPSGPVTLSLTSGGGAGLLSDTSVVVGASPTAFTSLNGT